MSLIGVMKILLSSESRKTAAEILSVIKKSPEWKKDLMVVNESFSASKRPEMEILVDFLADLLASKQWDDDQVRSAHFVISELIQNALEHGLGDSKKRRIGVKARVSKNLFHIAVTDPGPGFNLQEELERQKNRPPEPGQTRALSFISQLTSSLEQTFSPHKVSATMRRLEKACTIREEGATTIFSFQGEALPSGYYWAEVIARIQELEPERAIILDFSGVRRAPTRFVSDLERALLEHEFKSEHRQRLKTTDFLEEVPAGRKVAVVSIRDLLKPLQEFFKERFPVCESVDQALRFLNPNKR